jgi:hypothetical protein
MRFVINCAFLSSLRPKTITKTKGLPKRNRGRDPVKSGRKSRMQERSRTAFAHRNRPLNRFKN